MIFVDTLNQNNKQSAHLGLVSLFGNIDSSSFYAQELSIRNHGSHSTTHSEKYTNVVVQKKTNSLVFVIFLNALALL